MAKKYLVKAYKSGAFLGVLPYVVTDVAYTQDINTAGCDITLKLAADLQDAVITYDVDYLVDQSGNHIVDQLGNRIITRKDYVFTAIPVDIGNTIDVYVFDDNVYKNGKRIFSGLLSSWEADEDDASITITALSYGVELDNYLIQILPGTKIIDNPTYDTQDALFGDKSSNGFTIRVVQDFVAPITTTISSVSMVCSRPPIVDPVTDVRPYIGMVIFPGAGATLNSSSVKITGTFRYIDNTAPELTTFTFTTPFAVTAGSTYSISLNTNVDRDSSLFVYVGRSTVSTYSGGTAVSNVRPAGNAVIAGDYAFNVKTATGALGNQFNSYDPSDIITSLMESFKGSGGVVSTASGSVAKTNSIVSYTFKSSTILEGIQKCLELAPPNWYWYVDVGSNTLYFQRYSLTPNHTFIKGREIEKLKIKYSLENIKNRVLFTGGENPSTPGVNIISQPVNVASVAKYGQWLEKDSDTRVTTQATADIIASNVLGEGSQPRFSTSCTVLASRYDIESLQIGQMVAFKNFNELANSLILQIVSMYRTPDKAMLTLATLPPTQTHRIEDIKRNLDNLLTQNNPAQ